MRKSNAQIKTCAKICLLKVHEIVGLKLKGDLLHFFFISEKTLQFFQLPAMYQTYASQWNQTQWQNKGKDAAGITCRKEFCLTFV